MRQCETITKSKIDVEPDLSALAREKGEGERGLGTLRYHENGNGNVRPPSGILLPKFVSINFAAIDHCRVAG